jgi:hypothetical protein
MDSAGPDFRREWEALIDFTHRVAMPVERLFIAIPFAVAASIGGGNSPHNLHRCTPEMA